MGQRYETVNEYLKRGGSITKLPSSEKRNTSLYQALCGVGGRVQEEPKEAMGTLDWKALQNDLDPDQRDRQYWKKLDKRLNQLLREGKKKKRMKII